MHQKKDFEPHIGSTFVVSPQKRDDRVVLELSEIVDRSNPQLDAYSLMFLGPKAQAFDQGIQQMEHGQMGSLSMFLTPILSPGLDADLVRYEAVFSRLKEP